MSCGLPVIATTVGGTPEIVDNMKNGVLVPPRDPEAMAQALSNLLENNELTATIGKKATKKIRESFSWEENVRQLKAVYEEVLRYRN
jgi:glycosyltransferase involved in cell wall biosynthesis